MKKKIMKTFRISEEENERFKKQAKECQMKEAQYFRFLISQKPKDYPEIVELLKRLINEVNHVGLNINQIAKSIHSGYQGINDEKMIIAYMKKLNTQVKKVVDMIGSQ